MTYTKQLSAIVLLAAIASCKPNLKPEIQTSGDANFARVVTIGDNFMVGYGNGVLNENNQQHSVAYFVGTQLSNVTGAIFTQPLMLAGNGLGPNAKPWESDFVTNYRLGYKTYTCETVPGLSPLKDMTSFTQSSQYFNAFNGAINDYSAPFTTTTDIVNATTGANLYLNRFAPAGTLVLDKIVATKPTFATVWLGMEDVYKFIRTGAEFGAATTPATFEANLDKIVKTLNNNGTKGALANIPSFEVFPYYSFFGPYRAVLTQEQANLLNSKQPTQDANGDIVSLYNWKKDTNSFITTPANEYDPNELHSRHMGKGEYITLAVNVDSIKCQKIGLLNDIPSRYVLDSVEVAKVKLLITQYNNSIKTIADKYNWAHVDMNNYFAVVNKGVKNAGVDYSTAFLSGNFIGLDAFHPTQKGYEMISNEFIKAINTKYNATVWPVVCTTCAPIKFP
ncbi:MAG: hypothetical protein H7331_05670 [Bacteroidia bacterium]|nr:hypothetical protein [Bacteroidia bacterium]